MTCKCPFQPKAFYDSVIFFLQPGTDRCLLMEKMQTWNLDKSLLLPVTHAMGFSSLKPRRMTEGGMLTGDLWCIRKQDFVLPSRK